MQFRLVSKKKRNKIILSCFHVLNVVVYESNFKEPLGGITQTYELTNSLLVNGQLLECDPPEFTIQ